MNRDKPLKTPLKCLMVTLLISFSAQAAEKSNLRETCRREIAGRYLEIFDQGRVATNFIHALQDKIAFNREEIVKADKELADLKRKGANDIYLDEKIHQIRSRKNLSEIHIKDYQKQLTASRKRLEASESKASAMKKKLMQVFTFKDRDSMDSSRYPFKITYRSPCPKFRYQCPLPKEQRRTLKNIIKGTPQSCQRYAGIR